MKVAVTGANGFVGSNLCNYLEFKGIDVKRIVRKKVDNGFEIKNIDEFTDWSEALKDVEIVIHCLSIAHETSKKKNLEEYRRVNVALTKNLALQAVAFGVKKFIFISSIKAGCDIDNLEKRLDSCYTKRKIDVYGISKLEAERELKILSNNEKIDVVIIRPCLIYGPGVKANFLNLIKLVNSGIPLPFLGIKNFRSILYVDNLSDFIYFCLKCKKASNKTFLFSDPLTLSTNSLIYKIGFYLNKRIIMFYLPKKFLLFLASLIGSKEKVKKLFDSLTIKSSSTYKYLEYEPKFSTDEGIKKTINWYLNNKNK